MNKKVLIYVCVGIIVAALICLVIGLFIYQSGYEMKVYPDSLNFEALRKLKSQRTILGIIFMIVGLASFSLPALILIVLMVIFIVNSVKNKKNVTEKK